MSDEQLTKLLDAMPAIAKAVNSFASPEVQRDAFDLLMKAALAEAPADASSAGISTGPQKPASKGGSAKKQSPTKPARKAAATKQNKKGKLATIPVDDSLDIAPKGKTSLPDFVDEKNPKSQQDQSMVIVYWLNHFSDADKAGVVQIFTCYKNIGWKAPANPRNQLQVIAAKKQWLDTSDMDDVKLTHAGSQHVEHALPPKAAK